MNVRMRLWATVVIGLGAVAAGIYGVGRYMISSQRSQAPSKSEVEDWRRLKTIVSLLRTRYDTVPLTNDGEVDVYRLARDGHLAPEEALTIFWSARTGKGPSEAEIGAGEYSAFPYRRRGRRFASEAVPLLWDLEPTGPTQWRVAAFLDGRVVKIEGDQWEDLVSEVGPFDLRNR